MSKIFTSGDRHSRRGAATLASVAALTVPTIILGACCLAKPQERHEPPATEKAGKYFKNVKVLKDVPANRLVPIMREFNKGLGVKCDFCHVEGPNHAGFELDTKPTKLAARKMIVMAKYDNDKFDVVRGQVTCYMCHRGSPEPESKPQ